MAESHTRASSRNSARKTGFLLSIFISCLVFGAYENSLHGEFVFDDDFFVVENPVIRNLGGIERIFTTGYWESSSVSSRSFYRPLVITSYAFNYHFSELEPFGYHLLNSFLHLGNVLLVFAMVYLLSRKTILSATAALVFGLHPINTEAVSWISGRSDLLGTLFSLASCVFYVLAYPPAGRSDNSSNRRLFLGISLVAFFLGMLSKESSFIVLLVLYLYEFTFRPSLPGKAYRILPTCIVFVLCIGWRFWLFGGMGGDSVGFVQNPLKAEPAFSRILSCTRIVGEYLLLLVYPVNLSPDYSYNAIPVVRSVSNGGLAISFLSCLGLLACFLAARKRNPLLFFGLGFFFLTGGLIFATTFFAFSSILAERYMYMPSIGFVIASVQAADSGFRRLNKAPQRVLLVPISIICMAFFFGVRTRNRDWRDNFSLFKSAAEAAPNSALVQHGLCVQYLRRGELDPARFHCQKSLAIHPDHASAHLGLGNIALAEKKYLEAVEYILKAAEINSDIDEVHISLGVAYKNLGKLEQAITEYEAAISLNPKNDKAYNNLANIHLKAGDLPRAFDLWQEALRLDPHNAETLFNLGYNYERIGQSEKALTYYRRFLEVAPQQHKYYIDLVRSKLDSRPR